VQPDPGTTGAGWLYGFADGAAATRSTGLFQGWGSTGRSPERYPGSEAGL